MSLVPSDSRPTHDARRVHGRYYTPDWLAAEMVRSALAAFPDSPASILDPACGDGAFLVAAFRGLCESTRLVLPHAPEDVARGATGGDSGEGDSPDSCGTTGGPSVATSDSAGWHGRFDLARRLFGVDSDGAAAAVARERLCRLIAPPSETRRDVLALLENNIRAGDALLGPEFRAVSLFDRDEFDVGAVGRVSDAANTAVSSDQAEPHAAPLDWRRAFPAIAAAGGFDLIIGNPPYRRERSAREQFDRIAQSPLGRRWRRPRMDLWHYFAHRALDLLRPGGRLAFVVSSYWTKAASAKPLIARLRDETTFEEVVSLGAAPVFPGVSGNHMTFRVRKGSSDEPCVVRDRTETSGDAILARRVPQRSLIVAGRLAPDRRMGDATLTGEPLGERFLVRQGIAENPPAISRVHAERHPGRYTTGEGVFVLSRAELDSRPWTAAERSLLRPAPEPRRIARWGLAPGPERFLFYLTPRTAPALDDLPNLAAHLERFRPVLEARREVRRGVISWWHLHWPREERLFLEPRVLAPQMVRRPTFCVATSPTFVGFSVNLIAPRDTIHDLHADQDGATQLHALTAVLNSEPAAAWFETHAKRRGTNLDISGTALREFPLPPWRAAAITPLAALSRRCHQMADEAATGESREADRRLGVAEQALAAAVLDAYGAASPG